VRAGALDKTPLEERVPSWLRGGSSAALISDGLIEDQKEDKDLVRSRLREAGHALATRCERKPQG
jgi:hypothetical protein